MRWPLVRRLYCLILCSSGARPGATWPCTCNGNGYALIPYTLKGVDVFYLDFLTQAVDPADQVSRSFIEHMLPGLMEQYAVKSAKGGDHSTSIRLDEQTRHKFEDKDDQSMLSHQLNGIFPTLRLLNLLEAERLVSVPFSAVERQVYILSYLMHDVDKIADIHGVETRTRDDIEKAKDLVDQQFTVFNG